MSKATSIFADPRFTAGVEEFADAAQTVATSIRAFQLLLTSGVSHEKLVPHLQTAMAASERMTKSGEVLSEIINA